MQKNHIKQGDSMSEEKQLVKVTEKIAAPVACIGVGAAVGSMIAPGLGTAVGSGIGAIIWETATIIKAVKKKRIKQMFLAFMGCRDLK